MSSQSKILIVDDSENNRHFLNKILSSYDFSIVEAANGTDALLIAGTQLPDLIVMDVMMPEMSGFEVCQELKKDPKTETIPVILVTAHMTTLQDKIDGLKHGANDFITKPIDPTELLARIRAQLRIKGLQERLVKLERLTSLIQATGTLCHEINSPLTVIITSAQLVQLELEQDQPPDHESLMTNLDLVLSHAQRIAEVVHQMQQITDPALVDYPGGDKIIDIERSKK